jgi:hypothetical protein
LVKDGKKAALLKDLVGRVDNEALVSVARRLLKAPVDSGVGRAIEALNALGETPGSEALVLAARMDPVVHNPYSATRLARWWLESGVEVDAARLLVLRFAAQRKSPGFHGNPFDYEYALLALEFFPADATNLVAQALSSTTPNAFEQMAAYLSWVDDDWARGLLLQAAQETQDNTKRRFFVGCLQYSACESTAAQALALLPPPPEFPPQQPGYTREQVQFLNLRQLVERRRAQALVKYRLLHPH